MKYKDKLLEDFFDFLLVLANSDIKKMKDSDFVLLLYQYSENMAKLSKRYPLITDNRYAQIMDGVAPGGNILTDRRKELLKLKKHLLGLLGGIMKPTDKALIKMSGRQEVSISQGGQFVFDFTANKFKGGEFDWKDEKSLLDIIVMDLIRKLDLEPPRFLKCAQCPNYFYQKTAMAQIYCSTKCSNAAQQAKFVIKSKVK